MVLSATTDGIIQQIFFTRTNLHIITVFFSFTVYHMTRNIGVVSKFGGLQHKMQKSKFG